MELKRTSLSECTFTQTRVTVSCSTPENSSSWSWVESPAINSDALSSVETENTQVCAATRLIAGTIVQVRPIQRDSKDWDERHFHSHLKLPEDGGTSTTSSAGLVITLESRARECVAVALSPQPDFVMGKTYVVHFGALGNTCTVIRRRMTSNSDANCVTFPTPHICSDRKFLSYWVILTNDGLLTVGLGRVPGQNSIGTMDDSTYAQLRTGMDAAIFVGIGNSAVGRHVQDLEVRNIRVMNIPTLFQTIQPLAHSSPTGGIPITDWINPNQSIIQGNETESTLRVLHPDYHETTHTSSETNAMDFSLDGDEELMWAEYQKECIKAKARAAKFGVEYKMPSPEVFFKYSQAKRMRANPQKGFVTGLDITSPEEQEKAMKRMQRFQVTPTNTDLKRKPEDTQDSTDSNTLAVLDKEEEENNTMLPVEQAWDNQLLLQGMRSDPPEYLYPNSSSPLDPVDEEEGKITPEKLHLFAIDWAAFKQIRTDDVLAHFADYGPSYVEWLGELSCNIHFEDKYSASRALLAISQVLPSPPPSSLIPLSDEERLEKDAKDMLDSTSPDADESHTLPISDLGRMGWRFCKAPMRKTVQDRFGRVGTRARFLIRLASNLDVLEEKPMQRPKAPPGFTTQRILGPGSDFPKTRQRAESLDEEDGTRRKTSKRQRLVHLSDAAINDEPLGLSRSLKAPRASI